MPSHKFKAPDTELLGPVTRQRVVMFSKMWQVEELRFKEEIGHLSFKDADGNSCAQLGLETSV